MCREEEESHAGEWEKLIISLQRLSWINVERKTSQFHDCNLFLLGECPACNTLTIYDDRS